MGHDFYEIGETLVTLKNLYWNVTKVCEKLKQARGR